MSDFTIRAHGTFSDLYARAERAQDGQQVKGGKVLYQTGGTANTATLSTRKWISRRRSYLTTARIYDSIKNEYSQSVADRAFKTVLGHGVGDKPKVTLDKLRALKNLLDYEQAKPRYRDPGQGPVKFSAIAGDKAKFKGGKDLRFTAEKGLYVHTRWSTGFKNLLGLQTSREEKRIAAGRAVWQSIANEHGQDVADDVFKNVFGAEALKQSVDERRIAVTTTQFAAIEAEVKKFITAREVSNTLILEHTAALHDVMTVLFGPRGDEDKAGSTEAAFKRLENMLPGDIVQTLRDQPWALVAYMGRADRIKSLLDDAAGRKFAGQAWKEVFGNTNPAGQKLKAQDILDLRITTHIRAAHSMVPSEPSSGTSSKPPRGLWPGIRYNGSDKSGTHKIVRRPGISKDDARAYDDLKQIEAVLTAAETGTLGKSRRSKKGKRGGLRLSKTSVDIFTLRLGEIRTRFGKRLDENNRTRAYNRELNRVFQKETEPTLEPGSFTPGVPRQSGVGGYREPGPRHLMQSWAATQAELDLVRRRLSAIQTVRRADSGLAIVSKRDLDAARNEVSRLKEETGRDENECWDMLIDRQEMLKEERTAVGKAYRDHPWTQKMVRDYGDLGFRHDKNYLISDSATLGNSELQKATVAALTGAIDQANHLVMRLEELLL